MQGLTGNWTLHSFIPQLHVAIIGVKPGVTTDAVVKGNTMEELHPAPFREGTFFWKLSLCSQ